MGMFSSAGSPQGMLPTHSSLVADRAVDELVDLGQLAFAAAHVGVHAGDQLELRLAVVGGDARWVSAEPRASGCGVSARPLSGRTRRLSFSTPRRMARSRCGGIESSRDCRGFTVRRLAGGGWGQGRRRYQVCVTGA
jgi:hypothetical protein